MHLYLTADYIYNTDMSYNVYLREKMYFIHREETQTPPLMSTLSSESIEWGHMLYPLLCQHISTFTAPHSSMPMKWMAEGWEWSSENAFATVSVSKSPLININPRRKAPDKCPQYHQASFTSMQPLLLLEQYFCSSCMMGEIWFRCRILLVILFFIFRMKRFSQGKR